MSSERPYLYPAPGGSIEVRTGSNFHAAVMVFNNGYGSCEFARGPLSSVLEQVVQVMKEGATFGPCHEPGAPFKWHYFEHDDSYRASVHDGEFRIVRHAGLRIGVHARREGCSVMGIDDELPLLFSHMEESVQSLKLHVPLAIVHKGRRHVLRVASGVGEVFAVQVDASTRYTVTFVQNGLTASARVEVNRTVDGISICVASYTKEQTFDGHDGILWSDGGPGGPGKQEPPQITASPEGTFPPGPPHSEVAKSCQVALRHLSELGGTGRTLHQPLGNILGRIAASGKRVRGRGADLRKAIELEGGEKLPGGNRLFRYAMATCRRLGLLIRDGRLEAFAFNDLQDPETEFAVHLTSTYGTNGRQVEVAVTGRRDPDLFGLDSIDGGPPRPSPAPACAPSVESTNDHQTRTADDPAPKITVDIWPRPDATPDISVCTSPCIACFVDDTNRPTGSARVDPHGRVGDQVNWFRYQVHTPGEFAFIGTALGEDYLTKDNLTGDEFHRHIWRDVERVRRENGA